MKKTIILMPFFWLLSCCLYSAYSKDDAGTATAQVLKLGAGARAAGMGNAFTSVADDATAVYWNPAGVYQVQDKSVSLTRAVWFEGITYDWISYVQPVETIGKVGIGVQYISYGKLTETDDTGYVKGDFSPNSIVGIISLTEEISGVMAGVNVKYISSKIKKTAGTFAGDIGALYKVMENTLSLGVVVQNIGNKMKFIEAKDPLPMAIKIGASYKIQENWLAALDLTRPRDNKTSIGIGTEYSYDFAKNASVTGRLGYNTASGDAGGTKSISLGFGVGYLGYCVDYAFVPYGDLGSTHRIGISAKF